MTELLIGSAGGADNTLEAPSGQLAPGSSASTSSSIDRLSAGGSSPQPTAFGSAGMVFSVARSSMEAILVTETTSRSSESAQACSTRSAP